MYGVFNYIYPQNYPNERQIDHKLSIWDVYRYIEIQTRNLTRIPETAMFQGSYIFQTIILGIHVSFRECKLT